MLAISRAESAADLTEARDLFREYAQTIGFGLDFQGFDDEIADLEHAYAPPRACILIARWHSVPVGCAALRPLAGSTCEMKRMFVRPRLRGLGIGRSLLSVAQAAAREMGYVKMRLDTVPGMRQAISLYRSAGFTEISAYRFNPISGALFMELDLAAGHAAKPDAGSDSETCGRV